MSRYKAEKIFLESEPIILYSSTSPVLFSDNKRFFEWQTNTLVSKYHPLPFIRISAVNIYGQIMREPIRFLRNDITSNQISE